MKMLIWLAASSYVLWELTIKVGAKFGIKIYML